MRPTRAKALENSRSEYEKHVGHTMHFKPINCPRSGIVTSAVIINEVVMIKLKGQIFATEFADGAFKCSCGVGES